MISYSRTKAGNGYSSIHPQFTLYETDGRGRDMYINYNNGGFWRDNLFKIKYTPNYSQHYTPKYYTLFHLAAPFTYHSDGSGRDSYILLDRGLKRKFTPGNKFSFNNYLRSSLPEKRILNYNEMSKGEIKKNKNLRKIQNQLSNRLYHTQQYDLPTVTDNEPLIKFYAKTGSNFYINPKGKYSLTSPKYCNNKQILYRTGKKHVRVTLNEI